MESAFATRPQVQKVVFSTNTSVKSRFALQAQVCKVDLQHQHKCGKCFCNTNTSVESGFATRTQVRKVVFNTNTSAKSRFALQAQVCKVVLQH